jgi:K+-sensing histidine kinase KdpD
MLKAHSRYRQRTILADGAVDELIVVADESEMKQVLLNLITNALEAVEDSPAGVVRVNGRSDGQRGVELCIEDNGCGMSVSNRLNAASDYHFKCHHFENGLVCAVGSPVARRQELAGWRIGSRWQSIRQSSDWRG